jgi:catechol 2,3-dioxygenase-like lactoylglutathione lyase family enzyme
MEGVFHTGLTVSDLDRSIAFYRDVLGLTVQIPPTDVFGGEDVSRGIGVPGASLRLAVLKTGAGSLELLEYRTPASPIERPVPPNSLGAMHVAFQVQDIRRVMAELEAKGVRFLSGPNIVDDGPLAGWRWVYFHDPDGIALELVEFTPGG